MVVFNYTPTPWIYPYLNTLTVHGALPISGRTALAGGGPDAADAGLAAVLRHQRDADGHPERTPALPGARLRTGGLQPGHHLRRGVPRGAAGRGEIGRAHV